MEVSPNNSPTSVRVNVSLCGSIPRKEMAVALKSSCAPLLNLSPSDLNSSFISSNGPCYDDSSVLLPLKGLLGVVSRNSKIVLNRDENVLQQLNYEPPSWAVPACGEARLEPVCEAVGRQKSVDLTLKGCYRIGRSPNSDVQLMHTTSSRKHALIFHHSNGSCYIIDCGSAHGTFVNGVRIKSTPRRGVIIPHKVKRGAMIRFGSAGAPSYVLKSFPRDVEFSDSSSLSSDGYKTSATDVVRLNTRRNALGVYTMDMDTTERLKRPMQVFPDHLTHSFEPCAKRMRCSSPPLSPEKPMRLVSPDITSSPLKRRVTFSEDPPFLFHDSFFLRQRQAPC